MPLSTAQKSYINNLSPGLLASGFSFGDDYDSVKSEIANGNLGIGADAGDVDSLAKGGGAFSQDLDNTSGLTFGYKAGRIFNGLTTISVNAGTIALSASATNYVEVSRAGVVSKNTSGFTAKSVPLYTIVTGASTITTVTSAKDLLHCIPNSGIDGSMLTTDGATKSVQDSYGTVNATKSVYLRAAAAGTITKIWAAVSTTVATSDTNYWTATAANLGPSGGGSTALLASTDANTTKATGGSALTAGVVRGFTLHGTGANLIVAKDDLIKVTFTKTASGADLVDLVVGADIQFST